MEGLTRLQNKYKRTKFWAEQRWWGNYAFIHINKCGGTSIERFLDIPKVHDSARQRVEKIGMARWEKLFSFAIIRHPYTKVVSHYNYRVKTNQTDLKQGHIDLNTWIEKAYKEKDPQFYDKPLMFAPCFDWVSINDNIVVDKIIKLEELDNEWPSLCERIGIDYSPLRQLNSTNKHSTDDAVSKLSDNSINIIDSHFAKDFTSFNYAKV